MRKTEQVGICKLTGETGKFVKSHIIPRALTRIGKPGEKFVQAGIGHRITQPSESWYDGALAIEKGEAILSDIDSKAIDDLRKHRMVWSGWGNDNALRDDELVLLDVSNNGVGMRYVDSDDPAVLQIFFLSLLWRAAASSRPEFDEIKLDAETIEDLRQRVLNQDPGKFEDFPVLLVQLSTRGQPLNRTPLLENDRLEGCFAPFEEYGAYARFYFDGLVVRIYMMRGKRPAPDFLDNCWGLNRPSSVGTITYDKSRQLRDLREVVETVAVEQVAVREPLHPLAAAVRRTWTDEPALTHQLIHGWVYAVKKAPRSGRSSPVPYRWSQARPMFPSKD